MTKSNMMNNIFKGLVLIFLLGHFSVNGQILIYSQDFEDLGSVDWNLNTVNFDVGSNGVGVYNRFEINNQFNGGVINNPLLPIPITMLDTDAQPIDITNFPESNYLHTLANLADDVGVNNCNYIDLFDVGEFFPEIITAEQTVGVSTMGYDAVEVSFWWLGGDTDPTMPLVNGGGYLYFYNDLGGPFPFWQQIAGPFNSSSWTEITITNPLFLNNPNLRFMFSFNNNLGGNLTSQGVGFAVDQFEIVGLQNCFIDLGDDVVLCSAEDTLNLFSAGSYSNYIWANELTGDVIGNNSSISITEPGIYSLFIDSIVNGVEFCSAFDQIEVTQQPAIEFPLGITYNNASACDADDGNIQINSVTGGTPFAPPAQEYNYTLLQTFPNESEQFLNAGNTFNNLEPGIYEVIAEDAVGCTGSQIIMLEEPSSVVLTSTSVNLECDGSAEINISANTSTINPIQYSIDGGENYIENGGVFEDVIANGQEFHVVVSDGICTDFEFPSTLESIEIFIDSTNVVNLNCFEDSDGEIMLYPSGGTGVYQYSIDNGNTWLSDPLFNNLSAGTYTLITQDADPTRLCTDTIEVELFEPLELSLITSVVGGYNGVGINCFGDCTGVLRVQSIGGTAWNSSDPYEYFWMDELGNPVVNLNVNNDTLSDICAGVYMVSVTDSLGCVASDLITITDNEPISNYFVVDSVDCYGGSDGSVTAFASGGIAPYTYVWSGDTTQTYSNLTQGEYFVIIKDSLGCAYIDTAQIFQPTQIIVHLETDDVECYGEDSGELDAIVLGGTTPYSYHWYHPNFPFLSDYDTPSLDNVPPSVGCDDLTANPNYEDYSDPYLLTITDANGCIATDEEYLFEPCPLELLQNDTLSAYCIGLDPGLNTGYASVIASGGVSDVNGNYTFTWINGQTDEYISNISSISNQEAGDYNVVVVDVNDCSSSLDVHIPLGPTMYSGTTIDEINYCYADNNAIASAYGFGGCGVPDGCGYTYTWVGTTYAGDLFGPIENQTISDLQAGEYSVIVEDERGCQVIDTLTIHHPDEIKFTVDVIDQTCYTAIAPASDGEATINITGGFEPATYNIEWYDITPVPNSIGTSVTTASQFIINNLYADWWEVEVIDDYGCVGTLNFGSTEQAQFEIESGIEVLVSINEEPQVLTDVIDCYGDSDGHAEVLNPNSEFDYEWYESGNTDLLDQGAITNSLYAGDFIVQATYQGLCPINSQTITLTQNPTFNIIDNSINACFDESAGVIELIIDGGTPFHNSVQFEDYNHTWSVSSYNAEGIVNDNGGLHIDIENVAAGNYSILIIDGLGCDSVYEVVIDNLAPVSATPVVSQPDCHSSIATAAQLGSINTSSSTIGGTAPYTYLWSGDNGYSNASPDISNLQPGTYGLVVNDINGCESEVIEVVLAQPVLLTVEVVSGSVQNVSCNGGSDGGYLANIEGGSPNYSVNPSETGLTAGNYVVTATDANGCVNTTNLLITEPNAPITLNVNVTDAICAEEESGFIDLTVSGGTTPYVYDWTGNSNSGASLNENSEDLNYIEEGQYSVTVTDANGCQETNVSQVFAPAPVIADMTHDYTIPSSAPLYVAFVNTSTGADNIDWWIDGMPNPQFNEVGDNAYYVFNDSGEYEVSIFAENSNGCWDTSNVVITVQGLNEFNVFTPNNDGVNDYFSFETYGMSSLNAAIYNRWGDKIYEMTHPSHKWDGVSLNGQDVPEGTYFYVLEAVGHDGSLYSEKGSVTVYR